MLVNIKTDKGTLFINMDNIDAIYFNEKTNLLWINRKGQDSPLYYDVSGSNLNEAIEQLTKAINNESKSNIE